MTREFLFARALDRTAASDLRHSAAHRRSRYLSGALFACAIAAASSASAAGVPPRPSADAISQDEVANRVVSLITSLQRKDDIGQRAVEKAMKRKMAPGDSSSVSASLIDRTREGKVYRIDLLPEPDGRVLRMSVDAFRYGESDVCLLGFRRLHRDLTARGYDASRNVTVHGLGNAWTYVKGGVRLKASYLSREAYARGKDVASARLCVQTITVH
ncbi:hypothetical protein ACHZ97_17740 [Lysobacter soli]|uniref:hypothetical protein n=1 Tax=Lysobacter soli TaxID=453783 RepID=UPI0037C62E5D